MINMEIVNKIPLKIQCQCKICGFNSMTKKEVKRHLKSEHKIKRPYQYYKIKAYKDLL